MLYRPAKHAQVLALSVKQFNPYAFIIVSLCEVDSIYAKVEVEVQIIPSKNLQIKQTLSDDLQSPEEEKEDSDGRGKN